MTGRAIAITGRPDETALIQRLCATHRTSDPDGPHVTVVDGVWSYCTGHAEHSHEWRDIEPRPRQQLESDIATGFV